MQPIYLLQNTFKRPISCHVHPSGDELVRGAPGRTEPADLVPKRQQMQEKKCRLQAPAPQSLEMMDTLHTVTAKQAAGHSPA